MKTLICIILDRSGSMAGHESDTCGGVNNFVAEQQKLKEEAMIVLWRFDEIIEQFRPLHALGTFTPLQLQEVSGRGSTSLLDAIGRATDQAQQDFENGKFDRGVCIVVTDGQENTSRTYTKPHIKERIERMQEEGKWAFIYLGADVDAFAEASRLGIAATNAMGTHKSNEGYRNAFMAASASVASTRTMGGTVYDLAGDMDQAGNLTKWNPTPDEDFKGLGGTTAGAGATGSWDSENGSSGASSSVDTDTTTGSDSSSTSSND